MFSPHFSRFLTTHRAAFGIISSRRRSAVRSSLPGASALVRRSGLEAWRSMEVLMFGKRTSTAVLILLVCPALALAQATITGTVRDTSGAVLPGVTVEAASPALIE